MESGNKSARSKRTKVPATVFEFPQSSGERDQAGSNRNDTQQLSLSANEQALYDELIKTARRLDARRIPGVYALVAEAIERVVASKASGASALPALARGLDELKFTHLKQRQMRLKSWNALTRDGREGPGFAVVFLVAAIGFLLAGFASFPDYIYVSAFLIACAVACLAPTLWDMYTGR